MTNPTERPEERDSLGDAPGPYGNFGPGVTLGASRLSDGTLAEIEQRAAERYAGTVDDLRALEAEVKELREAKSLYANELEIARAVANKAVHELKQMEEALREGRRSAFAIAEMADGKGQVFLKRMADELCDQIDHRLAALSPSDTEEEA